MREKFTNSEIKRANQSSKSYGTIGMDAIVPRYVDITANIEDTILDFGSGKEAIHTKQLSRDGLDVIAYDFGKNVQDIHNTYALKRKYDIVMVSNVLNIQNSHSMLLRTLIEISSCVKPTGRAIMNYPTCPRYLCMNEKKVARIILRFFGHLRVVGGIKSAPIWEASF